MKRWMFLALMKTDSSLQHGDVRGVSLGKRRRIERTQGIGAERFECKAGRNGRHHQAFTKFFPCHGRSVLGKMGSERSRKRVPATGRVDDVGRWEGWQGDERAVVKGQHPVFTSFHHEGVGAGHVRQALHRTDDVGIVHQHANLAIVDDDQINHSHGLEQGLSGD